VLAATWRAGEFGHCEALAVPPEPVQAFHSDPVPQPLDLVEDGSEALLQLVVGSSEPDQPPSLSLLLLLHCSEKDMVV
jgi:hypothetical protein